MQIEETIYSDLQSLVKSGGNEEHYVLIGYLGNEDIYISNKIQIKEPDFDNGEKMDAQWIAEFAYQLNLRLPGGVGVVGLALAMAKCSLEDENRANKAIQRYYKKLPSFEKEFISENFGLIVCEFNGSGSVRGRIINGTTGAKISNDLKQVKFNTVQVKSAVSFDFPFYSNNENTTFSEKINPGLEELTKKLVSSKMFLKNGSLAKEKEAVNKKGESGPHSYQLFFDTTNTTESLSPKSYSCYLKCEINMKLECIVLSTSSNLTALNSLKQDLLRSLSARIELYSLASSLVASESGTTNQSYQEYQLPKKIRIGDEAGKDTPLIEYVEGHDNIEDVVKEVELLIGNYAKGKTIIDENEERFRDIASLPSEFEEQKPLNIPFVSILFVILALIMIPLLKYLSLI